jgi:outer membrane protein, heavy metal efflux system
MARTEPTRSVVSPSAGRRASALFCAALLATPLSACASRSIGSDVTRVRALSRAELLPRVERDEVETSGDKDVPTLLAQPLTEATAVRIALLNNRELRAVLRELGISRGRLLQAGLVANPTVEVELLPERESDLELRVEYDVTSLLLAPLAARAAGAELEAHRYTVAARVVQLGYEVRTAFYALAAAEQRLVYAQRTLDALTAGRDAALALLAAGNVPQLEASRQIVAYESARIEVAKIELAVADRREHVQRLLGLYGEDTQWRIAPGFADIPAELSLPERLETRALSASLDLKAIEQRLSAAGRRTGVARATALVPEVAVDFHALHADKSDSHNAGEQTWRYGGGVSVGVPLFDRRQGGMRVAEAEFDVLLERQQGLAIELRSRAREVRNLLVSTHARVRAYQTTLVPAQRSVMEQTQLMYNAMQLGVFELLAARRAQLEIELAYVDAQAAFWAASAQLDALLAGKVVRGEQAAAEGGVSLAGSDAAGGH